MYPATHSGCATQVMRRVRAGTGRKWCPHPSAAPQVSGRNGCGAPAGIDTTILPCSGRSRPGRMIGTNPGHRKGESEGEKTEARKHRRSPAGVNEKEMRNRGLEPAVLRGDTHRILTSRRARLRHRRRQIITHRTRRQKQRRRNLLSRTTRRRLT